MLPDIAFHIAPAHFDEHALGGDIWGQKGECDPDFQQVLLLFSILLVFTSLCSVAGRSF